MRSSEASVASASASVETTSAASFVVALLLLLLLIFLLLRILQLETALFVAIAADVFVAALVDAATANTPSAFAYVTALVADEATSSATETTFCFCCCC